MFKPKKPSLLVHLLYLAVDIAFIFLAFYLPYLIRWNIFYSWTVVGPLDFAWRGMVFTSFEQYSRLYIFWGIITIAYLHYQQLYKTKRLFSISQEMLLVFKAVAFSTLIAGLLIFIIKATHVSRLVFVGNFVALFILLSSWRVAKRLILRKLTAKGYNNFNVLIIGANNLGLELVREIKKSAYLGLKVVGFLSDREGEAVLDSDVKVLGKIADFEKVVHQYFIDEALITISQEREKVTALAPLAKELNVSFRVIPDPFELSMDVLDVYKIGHIPVLDYSIKELHGTDLFDKRLIDVVLAIVGILILWPLLIILAILIKISDSGSVFYVSKRYGKKGNLFNFYKFRTMVVNAEAMLEGLKAKNETDGPIFKMKNDPRINKIGRFMRRYSLDELPQLWNVLKGDMSIVGPRPLPLGQVETNDFFQLRRLSIKPGITGLWQIRGRSITSFSQFVKWDIWYINNWSLWLDTAIILRTFPAILKGRGAY
mgnify:CR=1 FL=1